RVGRGQHVRGTTVDAGRTAQGYVWDGRGRPLEARAVIRLRVLAALTRGSVGHGVSMRSVTDRKFRVSQSAQTEPVELSVRKRTKDHMRQVLAAVLVAVGISWAAAIEFPPNAEVLVT